MEEIILGIEEKIDDADTLVKGNVKSKNFLTQNTRDTGRAFHITKKRMIFTER